MTIFEGQDVFLTIISFFMIAIPEENLTFASDVKDGFFPTEIFNLSCSVAFWSRAHVSFDFSISDFSTGKKLKSKSVTKNGSVLSASLLYTYGHSPGHEPANLSFVCDWKIGYGVATAEGSETLFMNQLLPVVNVRLSERRISANSSVSCESDGFPEPLACTCTSYQPIRTEGRTLSFERPGLYLVNCTAENVVRDESYRSTWLGYLEVLPLESNRAWRLPVTNAGRFNAMLAIFKVICTGILVWNLK